MITSQQINDKIKEAIRKFGEYNYYDKQPYEVMDFSEILYQFDDMTVAQIIELLADVKEFTLHGDTAGETFVRAMVCVLDDRDDHEQITDDPRLHGMY